MKTLCQCKAPGFCPRHLCEKSQAEVRQCQTDWVHYHYQERKTDNLQPGGSHVKRDPIRCDVIMPYHAGTLAYVEEAARSILNQNNAEVILHLVGDGISPEDGIDMPGVRKYFTRKQVGPYAARMMVFDYLETDFILMADSDDIYHPNHCFYAVACLMDTGRDLFGASMEQFVDYRDGSCDLLKETFRQFPIITSGRPEKSVPDGNIVHATLAITKTAFAALNGYYDSVVGADTHLVRRASEAGYKSFISDKVVAQRRLHRTSLTNCAKLGIRSTQRWKIRQDLEEHFKRIQSGEPVESFGRLDKWIKSDLLIVGSAPRDTAPDIEKSDYDIDVFIPYYKNLHLVPQTIDSILWQHGVKPFIHLVNDCSREDDTELKRRYGYLPNVAWYKTKRNVGPYAIANSLFYHTRTRFIGIADSDDIYLPDHFGTAISDMEGNKADAWGSVMTQFLNPLELHTKHNLSTIEKHPIADSGRKVGLPYPRLVNGTMVIRKRTFEALNGFNGNWQCAADTEFSQRLQFPSDVGGRVFFSDQVTALRRICSNSLSNSDGKYGLKSSERDQIKNESVARYQLWKRQGLNDPRQHGTLDTQDDVLDSDYRLTSTNRDKITACIATIPRRVYALEKTIASLINQVDAIKVHLNDYQFVPEFLKNPKIELVFGDNSAMSCRKFLWSDKLSGFIFTCDDDLIYPPDYVVKMAEAITKHKCIVCAHGSRLPPGKIESFYKNRTVYDARREVPYDVRVDVPGTGVMAWHTDHVQIKPEDINLPGMEDIAAYCFMFNNSVPGVVVKHQTGWFVSSTHKNDGGLYSDSIRDDRRETELINAHKNHRA